MKYTLEVTLDNEAFAEDVAAELSRIVREAASRIELFSFAHNETQYPLRDVNGNKVGFHGYTRES